MVVQLAGAENHFKLRECGLQCFDSAINNIKTLQDINRNGVDWNSKKAKVHLDRLSDSVSKVQQLVISEESMANRQHDIGLLRKDTFTYCYKLNPCIDEDRLLQYIAEYLLSNGFPHTYNSFLNTVHLEPECESFTSVGSNKLRELLVCEPESSILVQTDREIVQTLLQCRFKQLVGTDVDKGIAMLRQWFSANLLDDRTVKNCMKFLLDTNNSHTELNEDFGSIQELNRKFWASQNPKKQGLCALDKFSIALAHLLKEMPRKDDDISNAMRVANVHLDVTLNLPRILQYHYFFNCPITRMSYSTNIFVLKCGHLISAEGLDGYVLGKCPFCSRHLEDNPRIIHFYKL